MEKRFIKKYLGLGEKSDTRGIIEATIKTTRKKENTINTNVCLNILISHLIYENNVENIRIELPNTIVLSSV